MRKRILLLCISLLSISGIAGCGKNEDVEISTEGKQNVDKSSDFVQRIQEIKENEEIAENVIEKEKILYDDLRFANYESVIMGSCEQDGDKEDGTEPIEWLVLDKDEDSTLLISKYVIFTEPKYKEVQCYTSDEAILQYTWDNSDLRKFLNADFYNNGFTEEERKWIVDSYVENENLPYFMGKAGENTSDKIFILSYEEAMQYFPNDESRIGIPTNESAINGHVDVYPEEMDEYLQKFKYFSVGDTTIRWTLRDAVETKGNSIAWLGYPQGVDYLTNPIGVRPVIRINRRLSQKTVSEYWMEQEN